MKYAEKRYSCVIIDDEFSSVNLIKEYIAQIPKLVLLKTFINPREALAELPVYEGLDFLFLDINMQVSGLDIARILRDHVKCIIFITGHPENALAAFGVNADDFIVKPIAFDNFLTVINRQIIKNLSDSNIHRLK